MSDRSAEQQKIGSVLQLSPKGIEMLEIMLVEALPDKAQQQRWREFDSEFQRCCVTAPAGNVALDGEAFAAFAETAHEPLVQKGVAIYNGCVKALAGLEGHDCRVFKCLAQLYLSAKMALKFR